MPGLTVGQIVKRGNLDIFTAAFDAVKIGADDLKQAISAQRQKAAFIEAVNVCQERFDRDMESLGCARNQQGNGWDFNQSDPELVEKSAARTSTFLLEEIPLEEITISVTKDEDLRKLVNMDANLILAGLIHISELD